MKKAFLQLHIAVFLAGFTGILGRLITMNEGMLVWYRLLITSVIMWVLYSIQGKLKRIPGNTIAQILGVGFIAAMHWITFYGSIKYANVSVALVCFSSIGFFTALLEPLVLRRRINKLELLFGLVTIAGIYIIFRFDGQFRTGIIIGLISAFLAALFPIFNRQLLQRVNNETLLSWQMTGGFASVSLIMPFYLQWFPPEHFLPSLADLFWLMILSVVCSVIAFQFSSNALRRLSAFTVNLGFNLEPVYGIILAFVVFHENKFLSGWFFVGFAIIVSVMITHVLMLIRRERRLARPVVTTVVEPRPFPDSFPDN